MRSPYNEDPSYQGITSPVMTSISFPEVVARVAESIVSRSLVALSSGEVGGMSIPAAMAAAFPMSVETKLFVSKV